MCKTVFLHFWLWVSHYQTVVRIPTACPHPLICNVKQNIWVPQRFWKISKIVTSWTHSHGLSCKTSFWWESVNFYVLFSYFFLVKMAQKMKKHCRADLQLCTSWPSPPIIEEKLAVAFLQRHQTKFWQKQAPVLRCWRYQDTTQSIMTIFWNIWIFPFHMVKWGLERSRYMFSSFWRTVFFD